MRRTLMVSLATVSLGGGMVLAPGLAYSAPLGVEPSSDIEEQSDTAVMGPAQEYQHGLTVNGVAPTLRSVVVNEESILAYCIEYWVQAADPDHESAVTGWEDFTGDNNFKTDPQVRKNVAWILRNSYPTLELAELSENAGVNHLTEAEAISATQSAIWHFTDDFVPSGDLTVNNAANSAVPVAADSEHNVQAVFDYLTGEHNTGLNEQEVQASVTLVDATGTQQEPPAQLETLIEDEEDHVLGPIQLNASTSQIDLELNPTNSEVDLTELSVLDANGDTLDTSQEVTTDEMWIHVPADTATGGINISAESTEYGYTGRLITPEPDAQRRFQTIVVVDQTSHQATSELELTWQQPDIEEEPPAPEKPPASEEPPTEEPLVEQPPAEQTQPEQPSVEEPDTATPDEPNAPADDETPQGQITPTNEPSTSSETAPVQATEALAETGAHQTRNILVALGTLAVGAALVVANRLIRKKPE